MTKSATKELLFVTMFEFISILYILCIGAPIIVQYIIPIKKKIKKIEKAEMRRKFS